VEGIRAARLGEPVARLSGCRAMIQITAQMRVLVAIEAVDGRKGIDSLAWLCQEKLVRARGPFANFTRRRRQAAYSRQFARILGRDKGTPIFGDSQEIRVPHGRVVSPECLLLSPHCIAPPWHGSWSSYR
jgi:hypothetical protein